MVNSCTRMALVKWFTFRDGTLHQLGLEEVSIYELKANPDYRFRITDVVMRLGEVHGQLSKFGSAQTAGQVMRITSEGKLKVGWTDGSRSEVYPHVSSVCV